VTSQAQENIEVYVRLGEHYGALYDAYGKQSDLDHAIAYEKKAFELREQAERPVAA